MSCLFKSIGQLLSLRSEVVRRAVCDYLAANRPILDGVDTLRLLQDEAPNYVARMREASTMGGAIEIQAACSVWGVRVVVENRRNPNLPPIEFLPFGNAPFTKTLCLYWTGGHYEPLPSHQC